FTYRTDLFNSLCQEWTEVASELYFKDYSIEVRSDLNTVSGAHTLNTLDVPVTSIIPFAKVVYVDLDLVDIISGKALTLLKNSLYSAATFPIARTVHFNFTNNNSSDNGENASTLKSLNIVNTPSETIINIFETSDGDPVAYPVLKKLVLTSMNKVPKPKYSLEDSPVLLPKLVDLSVKWGHPFHDDVLFRGNNATLEQAILMLDT
ncbi:hypothetical protein GGH92_010895, partial [Coemansia sp. RSA 2673]